MTWKKQIISIALCLCALLCAASVRAEATDEHSHPICGASHKNVGDHTSSTCSNVTWTAWNGGDITYDTNGIAYIYLSDDVTLQINNDFGKPKFLDVGSGKTLYLCLNGHSLTNRGSHTISVDGTLVLCDCKGSGKISHTTEEGGGFSGSDGIYVGSGAAFTMYGGTISSNNEGVQVFKGTFTMYGGKISNNDGRGVLVSGGTFTMYGGEISHNTCITRSAEGGGGVWVKDNGSNIGNFAMYGGTICNNTYKGIGNCGGGGVYASGTGDFIIQGGTITGNQCSYNDTSTSNGASGGGLYISDAHSKLRIENSTISNNTCDGDGGGIFIISNVTGSITNCTISNNSATGASSKGGGLAFDTATATITGGSITDNKTAGNGGGMAVGSWGDDSKITLSGSMNFSGNQDNYPADESGNLTTRTENDVFLPTGAYLRLADDFSKTSTAAIVVTTFSAPTNKTVKIAEGIAGAANAADFTYGNGSTSGIGIIAKTNNGTVELLACKHSYSTQKDETNHWQKCSICGDKKDVAKHTYSTDWQTNSTKHWHECECGQKSGEAEHSYSTAWDRDNTSHFHKCSACGDKTDIAICVYKARVTSGHQKSDATCTAKAVYWKSCVCDRESTETFESGETNPNNHTGQLGDWQSNDDGHWKEYSCCRTKVQEGAHNWNEGEVTTPATCTAAGEKTFTCTACSATKKETIPATGHAWDTEWSKDNDHHWHKCKNCNAIDESTKAPHSWDNVEVTTSATCTTPGVKTLTCTACSATKTERIDATGHAWDTKWSKDNDHHWHKCKNCNAIDTTSKAPHDWNSGTVTTPETCTTPGERTFTCTACSATKTETIPATGHAPGAAVCENKVTATCTTAGSYDEVVYCTACGNEVSRTKKTIDKLAHDYDTTKWVKIDNDHHGHKCKNCDAITDLTAHVPGAAATETTPQLCTVCGYVIAPATHPVHTWVFVAETPATCNAAGEREHYKCTCGRTSFKNGDDYYINEDASVLTIEKNSANHTGAPDSKWHSDSANHWQEYTCCHARANEAAHSGGAATCTAQAVCRVCGKAYGTVLGHDWGAWKVTTPATKDAPGVETRTCAHNSAHTETRSIPKLSTAVYTVSEDTKIAQIEAKVDGLDKILELNENKALVNDGKSVGVSLTVKNTASSSVSEKIKEKLAGSNLVGLRLELTVEKTVTANGVVESKQTIPDAGVLLKTTITLPTELQGKSGYVVYRLHDENVHVLTETANENGEFISVSADKTQITICARLYSEYVIAYQTGGSSGGGYHPVNPTPVKATSANTGDAGVLLYGVTAALSLTGTAWLGAKSRKH